MRAHLAAFGCNGQEISRAHLAAIGCNGLVGQSVRFNRLNYVITKSQYNMTENASLSMAMVTPERVNVTCMGFSTFHMT